MKQAATVSRLRAALAAGELAPRELVEAHLAAAEVGEGPRTFIRRFADEARAAADAAAARLAAGAARPLEGLPVSVKDLFDVEGVTTLAGSRVLAGEPPATRDSDVVARLRAAGAVLVGSTNMTEFAFSGVGLNPHYGTPLNPWDRASARIPGGSSSGAAVSVSDGMAVAAVGTDTGGSIRIPAALCGLVGYKPTAARISRRGVVPLSPSLDAVGTIGGSLACCVAVADVLAGRRAAAGGDAASPLRLAVVTNLMLDEVEPAVSKPFERALAAIRASGAVVDELRLPAIDEIASANRLGGFPAAEAYAWHRAHLDREGDRYDPRVLARIRRGEAMSAADYLELVEARARITRAVAGVAERYDALLSPTVPIVAPPLTAFGDDAAFTRLNLLLLRNPAVVNFIDGAAVTLPCHRPGDAPAGLMLWQRRGGDGALLRAAAAVEVMLNG